MVKTIEWVEGKVRMLDQSRLPLEVAFVDCTDYRQVAEGIKKLWIRGAPAIGIASAMGLALAARSVDARDFETFLEKLSPAVQTMIDTRPTAVNIRWAMERIEKMLLTRKKIKLEL